MLAREPRALRAVAGTLDFLLSTVFRPLRTWRALLDTLRPNGALCFVGVPDAPLRLDVGSLLGRQMTVSRRAYIGGRPAIREMLEFAARHGIGPRVQLRPLAEANAALDGGEEGPGRRYRVVLAG